jgi:hypothetical protein
MNPPVLLFQAVNCDSRYPDGLVEIVSESKRFLPERRFVVRYTDPWFSGYDPFVAFGYELQIAL